MGVLRTFYLFTFAVALSSCALDQDPSGSELTLCNGPVCVDSGLSPAEDDGVEPSFFDAGSRVAIDAAPAAPATHRSCNIDVCLPDAPLSCQDFDPNGAFQHRALYPSAPRPAPETLDEPSVDSLLDASAPPEEPLIKFSCQIGVVMGQPATGCHSAGLGQEGAPCSSTEECEAGLGCVGVPVGQCLPFCCSGQCGDGRFCTERPLRSAGTSQESSIDVPVCVSPEGCELSEPFPCPEGEDCTCPGDRACTIVARGATGCEVPGEGVRGEPCPCAHGFHCSSTGTCLELCKLNQPDSCGGQMCQATADFPEGWGLCVAVDTGTGL